MFQYDWKTKGICISAPATCDVDLFCEFVENRLAPDGVNLVVMLTRYRYEFKSHPECRGDDPLSEKDVKAIVGVCRAHNIRLVPKMNLLGHQSGKGRDTLDGLLRGHPEFDETPEIDESFYCRSLCPNYPGVKEIVFDLMDEMVSAFESDALHIGCDEVFELGKCPSCRDTSTAELFAGWINALHDHLAANGKQTLMWGDRFLDGTATGYGAWEASQNGTEASIDMVSKDILICDWHYEDMVAYKSVEVFAKAGFKTLICPWRFSANAHKFADYAREHDGGNIEGLLLTTWCNSGDLMRGLLGKEAFKPLSDGGKSNAEYVAETYRSFYMV